MKFSMRSVFSIRSGKPVTVLEARTYSPVAREAHEVSLCGYFSEISMPARNFETARVFWEPLGFVATDETEEPYVHLPFTSDHIDIAFHRPRTFDVPMLVFRDAGNAGARRATSRPGRPHVRIHGAASRPRSQIQRPDRVARRHAVVTVARSE